MRLPRAITGRERKRRGNFEAKRLVSEAFMKKVRAILCSLFALGFTLISAGAAYGQYYPGRVTATVQDSPGAMVTGADVKLTAADIGFERDATTSTAGTFSFAQLPLGTFKLTGTRIGFNPFVQTGIVTSLENVNEIQVTLVPGAVSTQIEVTSAAPL